MAMAWIWTGMAVVSVVCGAVYGRMEAVSAAALEGAGQAVRMLPTTVASIRAVCGSAAPLDILPAVWVSSLLSVTAGLAAAKLLERLGRRRT